MKRFLAALLAALTVFTLTGCGKTENPAEPVTPGQGEEPAAPTEPELTPEEIAEWIYFVGVRNRFMTGQNR